MQLRDRFKFDQEENLLFIDFAGLRIETRQQLDETRRLVREILESRGRRAYAIVNYEGTEIAPEIVDYYGESIKDLYDRDSLTTVRYSSSGLTISGGTSSTTALAGSTEEAQFERADAVQVSPALS